MSVIGGGLRTKCSILTGFLGAGKTTLVNHILSCKSHEMRIAVIENEFGEVGVDDAILLQTEEEIFEMNNGCICCTVRGDLMRILGKLARRSEKLDHILIETTGLADPAPVAQTFFVDEDIKSAYELDAIITVVDARHIGMHLDEKKREGLENESVEQIAFADKILLNKIDLVDDEEKTKVLSKLRFLNTFAEIIETDHSAVDIKKILQVGAFDLTRILHTEENFLDIDATHEHDETVTSVGNVFEGELSLTKLNEWLTNLLREKGVDIFRCKGVLSIAGSDARYVFQGVHMLMELSSSSDGIIRPWGASEKRLNRVVFIGRNLNRDDLLQGFQQCNVD